MLRPLILLAIALTSSDLTGQTDGSNDPEWIWSRADARDRERLGFRMRCELDGEVRKAVLEMSCDNHFRAWLNGTEIADGDSWERLVVVDVSQTVRSGSNVLAIEGRNDTGPAGLCGRLHVTFTDGSERSISSSTNWRQVESPPRGFETPDYDDTDWAPSHSFGPVSSPRVTWANPFVSGIATPIERMTVADGFAVELVYSAQPGQGSWVCLTFDDRARLIIAPESGRLLRMTLPDQVEFLPVAAELKRGAQGLAWFDNSLYLSVNARAKDGGGMWRLRDRDGDDEFEQVDRLAEFDGGSEHGTHAIVPGPDGMLYTIHGNMTSLPQQVAPESPFTNWAEDVLLPRETDPRGHAARVRAPGSRVLRTDGDGSRWEIVAAGMRNAYDIAFDHDGNLFTFDSDMEWDRGLPWYRPTRLLQIVAGGEYGWRTGSSKWPAHSLDSLGAVADLGEGSPTGMVFGGDGNFPGAYRHALFLGDWARGRILAAHVRADGESFAGHAEEFVTGKPLNVTDMAFGPDGAMYFVTGGRGTQSGLYRVRATQPESDRGTRRANDTLERMALEIDEIWRRLGSDDRVRRFRARVALEQQDVASWRERALATHDTRTALHAQLALARAGDDLDRAAVIDAVAARGWNKLSRSERLDWIRTIAVACSRRQGPLESTRRRRIVDALDAHFPTGDSAVDREAAAMLAFCNAPQLTPRLLAIVESAASRNDQIAAAMLLRHQSADWTDPSRERFFGWLRTAKTWTGGESLVGYLQLIERRALEHAPPAQRAQLAALATPAATTPTTGPIVAASYTHWTLDALTPHLGRVDHGRSFESGRRAFQLCATCHRFAGSGGSLAPDLTTIARRFTRTDLLRDVLEPNRVISDQYANTVFQLRDGDSVIGRVVAEEDDSLIVCTDPIANTQVALSRSSIQSSELSPYSSMPPGLLGTLTRDQILDLLAFFESEGDAEHPAFRRD